MEKLILCVKDPSIKGRSRDWQNYCLPKDYSAYYYNGGSYSSSWTVFPLKNRKPVCLKSRPTSETVGTKILLWMNKLTSASSGQKKKKNPKKLFCAQLSACTELTINYPVYLRDTAHSQFISLLKKLRNTAFFLCSWLLTIEWQLLRESWNPLVLECYKARNRQKSAIKTTEKLLCTLEKYCLMEPWSVATLG